MNLVWNIIRKDLIRFRFALLAWLLLLAGKYLLFASISGVFGHPSPYWIRLFAFPQPLFYLGCGGPAFFAFFLVGSIVFEDPPAGRDPFWVTRPISGAKLLAAKLIMAVSMFVIPPVLFAAPWWLACGFGPLELGPLVGQTTAGYLVLILLGVAVASATRGYPRYFVWTFAGVALVLAANLLPLVFGRLVTFELGPFGGIVPARANLPLRFYVSMLAVCLAVLSVELAGQQFVVRHFRKSLLLVPVLTLAVSAWFFSVPPAGFRRLFSPPPTASVAEDNIRVSVAGDVRTFLAGGLSVPLKIDGLPDDAVSTVFFEAQWKSVDGKVWPTRGGSGGNRRPIQLMARKILHLPPTESAANVNTVYFNLAAKHSQRIATEAATIQGQARVVYSPLLSVAEIPLGNRNQRFRGGSFTVSKYAQREGAVSLTFTFRVATAADQYEGIGYIALVNHRTGEVIEAANNQVTAGGPPVGNDVVVFSLGLTFVTPDATWVQDANLVVLGLGPRRQIVCDVPTFTRPPDRPAPLFPESVPVSPEILHQYVGTYRQNADRAVTITELKGNLLLKPSGGWFGPKVGLTAKSETQFSARYASWIFAGDGFELEFKRDASGRVSHFVVHESGHDFVVPRIDSK